MSFWGLTDQAARGVRRRGSIFELLLGTLLAVKRTLQHGVIGGSKSERWRQSAGGCGRRDISVAVARERAIDR